MSKCYKCHVILTDSNAYKKSNKKYYASRCKSCDSAYYQENKSRRNVSMLAYEKNRIAIDPNFKILRLLRARLRTALKHNFKSGSAVSDLGCSIEELRKHLQSNFQVGMTWENQGKYGWHIDHIIPLASFDLSDRSQFLKAVHYTNLQPLWAKENISKKDKIKRIS